MSTHTYLHFHLVRHEQVASHQGDVSITEDGLKRATSTGQQFAEQVSPDESIFFLYAPTRRTRETAEAIRQGLIVASGADHVRPQQLFPPTEQLAIRNPDLYVGGRRVEMVSSAQAMAEQTAPDGISAEQLLEIPFLRGFWEAPDRIGYWVNHSDPPGEDADTVARRVLTFALSLLDLSHLQPRRYICVTHSPVMRAFIRRYLLGHDPGEPAYSASIDMLFSEKRLLTLRFRDATVTRQIETRSTRW